MHRVWVNRVVPLSLLSLASALLVGSQMHRAHELQKLDAETLGHFSRLQVEVKAADVCRMISAAQGDLAVTAQPHRAWAPAGDPLRYWSVDCAHANGPRIANMVVDALSGGAVYIVQDCPIITDMRSARPFSRATALAASRDWLRELGIAHDGEAWTLQEVSLTSGPPNARRWATLWRSGRRTVSIQLRQADGALVLVFERRQERSSCAPPPPPPSP